MIELKSNLFSGFRFIKEETKIGRYNYGPIVRNHYHIEQIANTIDANWAKYHLGCLENDDQLEMVIEV